MIASYAHISIISRLTPLKKFNVLYYGYDRHIKTFLEYQDNINSVTHVMPTSKLHYEEIAKEASNTYSKEWIKTIFGIDPKSVIATHLSAHHKLHNIYIRDFDYKLPPSTIDLPENSIIFNPYSMQSCPMRGHWRFIPEALEWLLKNTDWNIVMVGQKKYDHAKWGEFEFPIFIKHPRLLDLVDKTESMIDVLSLVEQCKGIVTTSNSLSMWSAAAKKPTLVMLNTVLENPAKDTAVYYFRKWIEHDSNLLLSNWATLEDFEKAVEQWKASIGA